jgi:hypothetical protein
MTECSKLGYKGGMKYIFLFTILMSSQLFAEEFCDQKLLSPGGDSRHYSLYAGDVMSNDSEKMDIQMAYNSANAVNKSVGCNLQITAENSQIVCTEELLKNHLFCNIKVRFGYYIIFKDYVDTVHVVFNRWD